MAATLTLNERAMRLAEFMAQNAASLHVAVQQTPSGARFIDCGVQATGGLQAGLSVARVCLAGLAEVSLVPGDLWNLSCPAVQVMSDHPVLACMASQYAGWQISVGKFFAMGSGPMRAAYGHEELYSQLPGKEQAPVAVGVMETSSLPDDEVVKYLCDKLHVPANKLLLLAAPCSSLAGTVQVVARSLETALHKLHELKFDLSHIVCGYGTAPLPPVAKDDLHAIGRTNDAILYGGRVVLWVNADDAQLAELGPRVPSSASLDHGAPFVDVFERYQRDFYKIDPKLFSPAVITLNNLKTGTCHTFGRIEPEILRKSFQG